MDTTPDPVVAYVQSTAAFLQLPLDAEQVLRVALHLARTRAMVMALRQVPLAPGDELAEIFRPAPFPEEDPS
jgi:hypothetical protein